MKCQGLFIQKRSDDTSQHERIKAKKELDDLMTLNEVEILQFHNTFVLC